MSGRSLTADIRGIAQNVGFSGARWEAVPLRLVGQIAVFAQPGTGPGADGAGLAGIPSRENFKKAIFGVFSASHSPSDSAFVLLPVAKRSSEVTCLWPGRRRRLGWVFWVGRSGGLWRAAFSVVWVETVLDLGVFSGLDGIVFDFE